MAVEKSEKKKRRIAWGITGSGDRLIEIIEVMKEIKKHYQNEFEIFVYLSKAGEQVVKYYRQINNLKENFDKIWVEINSNLPFLAGQLELGKFEFLLIAPATSNTVTKISIGIADSLLSNSAVMALKGLIPVYIMPSDYREGIVITKLPNGQDLKLRIRKEEEEHVKKLARMEHVFILERPEDLKKILKKHFNLKV